MQVFRVDCYISAAKTIHEKNKVTIRETGQAGYASTRDRGSKAGDKYNENQNKREKTSEKASSFRSDKRPNGPRDQDLISEGITITREQKTPGLHF